MIDPNESFGKACPGGNTLIDSDIDLNRNPEEYEEYSEEYVPSCEED